MNKKRPVADILLSLTIKEIARRARVDPSTARRWKRGDIIPGAGILLVLDGDLGAFDLAWDGWVIRGGKLCSPENWICTPGEIRALQLKEAQVSALRREVELLRYELDVLQKKAPWLDEQPSPEEIASWQLKLTKI